MPTIKIKNILATGSHLDDRFIPDHTKLKKVVDTLKRKGYRVVLTQGVYDLIHEGHIKYLEVARSYGDILVVAADSDALTKRRKGNSRPIVLEDERIKMLVHLRHVDIVTLKNSYHDIEDELIELIQPDVFIASKSTSDFSEEKAEYLKKYCGEVKMLPPQSVVSTTARIRNLTIDGADQLASELTRSIPQFVSDALAKIKGN